MKYIFSPSYEKVDIGDHIFPLVKYRLIKEKLISAGKAQVKDFIEPGTAKVEDILLVHTGSYVDKLLQGTLSFEEQIKMELPFSRQLVESSMICVEGTIRAFEEALVHGVGVHLGGGFHHAYPDHGEGFCVLHDVAIAIKKLRAKKKVNKVLIIDCDLHQGNGTAYIFRNEKDVFTFSMQQEDIYPFPREKSSLDVNLARGTDDATYLVLLQESLEDIFKRFKPGIIFYIAGADPYKGDQLSGLKLTIEGLRKRDALVMGFVRQEAFPVAVVLAGGYAADVNDTVTIHYNTCLETSVLYKS